jgi:hypothetical protein
MVVVYSEVGKVRDRNCRYLTKVGCYMNSGSVAARNHNQISITKVFLLLVPDDDLWRPKHVAVKDVVFGGVHNAFRRTPQRSVWDKVLCDLVGNVFKCFTPGSYVLMLTLLFIVITAIFSITIKVGPPVTYLVKWASELSERQQENYFFFHIRAVHLDILKVLLFINWCTSELS